MDAKRKELMDVLTLLSSQVSLSMEDVRDGKSMLGYRIYWRLRPLLEKVWECESRLGVKGHPRILLKNMFEDCV